MATVAKEMVLGDLGVGVGNWPGPGGRRTERGKEEGSHSNGHTRAPWAASVLTAAGSGLDPTFAHPWGSTWDGPQPQAPVCGRGLEAQRQQLPHKVSPQVCGPWGNLPALPGGLSSIHAKETREGVPEEGPIKGGPCGMNGSSREWSGKGTRQHLGSGEAVGGWATREGPCSAWQPS